MADADGMVVVVVAALIGTAPMSSNVLLIENLHGCKSGSKCRDSQSEAIIFGV